VLENKLEFHTLNVLEFDKIIKFLGRFASTELGKQRCRAIFSADKILSGAGETSGNKRDESFSCVSVFFLYKRVTDLTFFFKKLNPRLCLIAP
jgi:dsDNA-specific endonuclease/ATPase MutS2